MTERDLLLSLQDLLKWKNCGQIAVFEKRLKNQSMKKIKSDRQSVISTCTRYYIIIHSEVLTHHSLIKSKDRLEIFLVKLIM